MAKYDTKIKEEELKNRVATDWFDAFDTERIIGNIDFCVDIPATELSLGFEDEPAMWAEAKAGDKKDICESFVQLILTIGRGKIADKNLPPIFLGAFDAAKIAFLPYNAILAILSKNDFNWNVTPSDHESKEFKELYALAKETIEAGSLLFDFEKDEEELRKFIKANFKSGTKDVSRIRINKNNFTHIYQKWREAVLPSIGNIDWLKVRKAGIIEADFYLADVLSDHNQTLRKKLYVLLNSDHYECQRGVDNDGLELITRFNFKDGQKAHTQFWNRYIRPPQREYWNFMVERRDLLVPQDVRERKGSFYTPKKWVELSQEYLANELGDDWQDHYYIWDCCAGTGNLLAGLTNKYNIWASTLDKADVDVMHARIKMMNEQSADGHGASLLDSHVFQFDFLNDSFDNLPDGLRDIINDPEKRERLVIYINPPYAEAGDARQRSGTGKNKTDVAVTQGTYTKYLSSIGIAGRELFAQFFMRIATEINGCILGQFSKLKHLQSPNFKAFRQAFSAKLKRGFIVPADTFDNVKGQFPIGFFVWDLSEKETFKSIVLDVYDRSRRLQLSRKEVVAYDSEKSINDWLIETRARNSKLELAFLSCRSHDIQHVADIYFKNSKAQVKSARGSWITDANIREACVYVAACHTPEISWLNDRDQFLFPDATVMDDEEFVSDCIAYTLLSQSNYIQAQYGINHWIPYSENEVLASDAFDSHFMSEFLAGRAKVDGGLFSGEVPDPKPIEFSAEAQAVMDAGRELWKYYHSKDGVNVNASFYDIRRYFQGVKLTASGKEQMRPDSDDAQYNSLLAVLRAAQKKLAKKIEPKVYAYGFLK